MKAKLLLHERQQVEIAAFVEIKIWQVPKSVKGSAHLFKYSLAYVVNETCVLRYDNEAGKGDHKHISDSESDYAFSTTEQLLKDFWIDVDKWGNE